MSLSNAIRGRHAARSSAAVGVPAGLLAGAAYLLAQMLFARLAGGSGAEPLQRIAAILMGPDAAPPPGEWSAVVVGMALIIHLPLSAVYGRVIDHLVAGIDGVLACALAGAVVGALMFVLHRWFIAPLLFPWFEQSRNMLTAVDHLLFGVVAALACHGLRRRVARFS